MTTSNQHLDSLIAERLGGDESRVLELFREDGVFDQLAAKDQTSDWTHFRKRTLDGDYFVRSDEGFDVYLQERGVVSGLQQFSSMSEAAAHFFRSTGFSIP